MEKRIKGGAGRSENKQNMPGSSPKRIAILLVAVLCVMILVAGAVMMLQRTKQAAQEEADTESVRTAQEEAERKQQEALQIEYDRIMHSGLFLPGITIEGIDVQGMNRPEAAAVIEPLIEDHRPAGTIDLVYGDRTWPVDVSAYVSVTNDSEKVLDAALKAARSDDMAVALKNADEIAANGKDFLITFSYHFDKLPGLVTDIASEIDTAAKSARFVNIDKAAHTAEASGSVTGLKVLQEDLLELLQNAVLEGDLSPIEIPVSVTEPSTTESVFRTRDFEFSTSFKGSTENRVFNINKGVDIVNGTLLLPGEIFSMNDTLGTRSFSAGWKEANAYVSGGTDLQAGGGVCQISTTLYNAAVMADLEIVSRQNHSMPVSYIKKGLDATINSVGFIIDFQFKNNTPYDLLIFTWTEKKILHAKIIRCEFETDEYDEIRLSSEQIETIEPDGETVVTQDDTLKPGESVTDVARRTGSVWQSYKEYYKNGHLVKKEPLAKSTYKAFNGSVRVGPPLPEETPSGSHNTYNGLPIIG